MRVATAREHRVLFFDAHPHAVGGAQRLTVLLAGGLERRGWQVTVATPPGGPYPDLLRRSGVEHWQVELPPALLRYGRTTTGARAARAVWALPGVWARLSARMRARFDIVHTVDARAQILAAPAARLAGIPVVWHVHSVEPSRAVNWFCRRFAARTLVPAAAAGGRPGRSVVELGNVLPPDARAWMERPAPPLKAAVVSVGRLHPEKGQDVLVEALARLRTDGLQLPARFIGPVAPGQESYARAVSEACRRAGVEVTLEGAVGDVPAALAAGGVYVQPSRSEREPLAVLEAMAVGLPVVATAVGGLPALLGGGSRGWLVPSGDPAALAQAIHRALTHADEARQRIESARRFAAGRADVDSYVARVEAVYLSR